MKRVLTMLMNFLIVLFIGLFIGAFIHIQYITSISMVAGKSMDYSSSIIWYSLIENAPIAALITIPAILLWKIRHLENPLASALTFVFLCLLCWLIILPLSISLRKFLPEEMEEKISRQNQLSQGYFRTFNDKYYYFLSDEDTQEQKTRALMLFNTRTSNYFGDEVEVKTDENSEIAQAVSPFKDPLYFEIIGDIPWRTFYILTVFKTASQRAWKNGYISWLCFCSFGLLISSAYCFIRASKWRMVNITTGIVIQVGGLIFNTLYFTNFFEPLRLLMMRFVYGDDFSRFQYFQNHQIQLPLTIVNVFFGLSLITTGIIISGIKRKKYS